MLAVTFVACAMRYWLGVFPRAGRELRHWRRRAARVPDPTLRLLALAALEKRGNAEGAAAFAVLAPRRQRARVLRALIAFQTAYGYLDTLAEQPSSVPVANARRLHQALCVALDPVAEHGDYLALHLQCDDGGYLVALIDACRTALRELPSHDVALPLARAAGERIAVFQSLILGDARELACWARTQVPPHDELEWWEAAAAAGSSLPVCALIVAAASPRLSARDSAAIEAAYFPHLCALHSLLDSLVDVAEDAECGQLSLVGLYSSPRQAAMRMRQLALQALVSVWALPRAPRHTVLAVAMVCSYLSAPELHTSESLTIARGIRGALGSLATPTLLVFRARRIAGRMRAGRALVALAHGEPSNLSVGVGERQGGADAGAV